MSVTLRKGDVGFGEGLQVEKPAIRMTGKEYALYCTDEEARAIAMGGFASGQCNAVYYYRRWLLYVDDVLVEDHRIGGEWKSSGGTMAIDRDRKPVDPMVAHAGLHGKGLRQSILGNLGIKGTSMKAKGITAEMLKAWGISAAGLGNWTMQHGHGEIGLEKAAYWLCDCVPTGGMSKKLATDVVDVLESPNRLHAEFRYGIAFVVLAESLRRWNKKEKYRKAYEASYLPSTDYQAGYKDGLAAGERKAREVLGDAKSFTKQGVEDIYDMMLAAEKHKAKKPQQE